MVYIAKKTRTRFDDLLVTNKTAKYIAHLIPLLYLQISSYNFRKVRIGKRFGKLGFTLILILWIIRTIFNALRDYLKLKPRYSDKTYR
jgi:miniconductance mechanosensitive channel